MPVTPEERIAHGQELVDDGGIGEAQRLCRKIMLPDIEQLLLGVLMVRLGDSLHAGVGPLRQEIQEDEWTQGCPRPYFLGPRVGEELSKPCEAISIHKDIEQVQHAIALTDEFFELAQTLGFRLGG